MISVPIRNRLVTPFVSLLPTLLPSNILFGAPNICGHLSLMYKPDLRQSSRVRSSKFPSRDDKIRKHVIPKRRSPLTDHQPSASDETKLFFFVPLRASPAMIGVGPPRTSGLEVLGLGSAQPRQALRSRWPFALLCLFIFYSGHKSRWPRVPPDMARRDGAE